MLTVVINDDEVETSVSININGNVLMARSCRNTGESDGEGRTRYVVDDGSVVWHRQSDGAVELAKKLLETIQDPCVEAR